MQILQSAQELEDYFAELLTNLTGLPEDKVLLQHQPEGQPSSSKDQDVLYIEVTFVPDERENFKNRFKTYNTENEGYTFTQQAQRTLSVQFVFYGPNSSELATLVNEKVYFQDQKLSFQRNHLALVPDRTEGPLRMHENYNGQWYDRCDLTLYFYNTLQVEEEVGTFAEYDIRTEVN